MAVLIKGMEMPKSGAVTIRIVKNGDVIPAYSITGIPCATAVEVPTPHGRLIEEKTFLTYLWGVVQNCRQGRHMPFLTFATVESVAEDTPTIIEAEE